VWKLLFRSVVVAIVAVFSFFSFFAPVVHLRSRAFADRKLAVFLIATKQSVKRTRLASHVRKSDFPPRSRSLPVGYRQLRIQLAEAETVRDSSSSRSSSSSSSSCLIPPRLVSSRVHNECRASQLYRVCGRASRFPRTTSVRSPSPEPFGSLFSDSEPADLQATHPRPDVRGKALRLPPRCLFRLDFRSSRACSPIPASKMHRISLSLSLSLSLCVFFSLLSLRSHANRVSLITLHCSHKRLNAAISFANSIA